MASILGGCGSRSPRAAALEIGYAFYSLESPWHAAYLETFKEELKEHPNLSVAWFDGRSDQALVASTIEKWTEEKVDLIVSSSPDHMPLRMHYQKALEAGMPVLLTIDSPDYRVYEHITAFSGLSEWDAGRMAAEILDQALGGKGRIACITGPRGSASEQQNTEGFKAALQRLSSGIRIAATEDGRGNVTVAYQKTLGVLDRFPDIHAIYTADDVMGSAVIRALKEKGHAPGRVKVVSQGGSRGSIADLKEGWYLGIVYQDPELCARQDLWMMRALLEEGRSLPRSARVRQDLVTKDNATAFSGW